MTAGPTPMELAFAKARQPGAASAPVAFLALANQGPPALEATTDDDEALFGELHAAFDYIPESLFIAPSAAQIAEWAALLRWLIAELKAWSDMTDPGFSRLRVLLAVSVYINGAGDPWAELAQDLASATSFHEGLARFIAGVRIDTDPSDYGAQWERQTAARFRAADQDQDWDALSKLLPSLMPAFQPPWLLSQASWALSFVSPGALVQATEAIETTLCAAAVVSTLPVDLALALGAGTGNDRLRFAIISLCRRNLKALLSPALEASAVALFVNVGADPGRWSTWMRACFQHPRAYAALMAPLGKAMAQLPHDRSEALLEVLPLDDQSESRWLAAVTFEAFASVAPPDRRKALWASAYRRWLAWGFEGFADGAARSTLDYAVVGHLVEGLTPAERRAAGRGHRIDRTRAETGWSGGRSDIQQARYRLGSVRLVHIWARKVVSTGASWLDPSQPDMPRAFRSPYRDLRFNDH